MKSIFGFAVRSVQWRHEWLNGKELFGSSLRGRGVSVLRRDQEAKNAREIGSE